MKYLKRLVLMVQFLTTIPINININCKEEDYGKGLVFAPVVGLLIGSMLMGLFYIVNTFFSFQISVVFMLITYIVLSGGLHLDGLADTFDGIFSNRPKERILDIMRDSRIGTNGVLAIVCIMLLNFALLNSLERFFILRALLLFPVAGRMASLVGAGTSKYAREGEGLGKSFIDFCGIKEVLAGFIITMGIFYIALGTKGLILTFPTIMFPYFFIRVFTRKIGGATGDILGAICELNQTVFIISVVLLKTWI
ncbi:UNVERIFIED_CONTAM: cobalamin-5'-phosphate synthase [Acetivibrio alkalicellulosi]